jgi:hypothetical protein
VQLRIDPGAYVFCSHDVAVFNVIAVYINGILMYITSSAWITSLKGALAGHFDIKDLGPCKWPLSMTILRDIGSNKLTTRQDTYIRELLRRLVMEG